MRPTAVIALAAVAVSVGFGNFGAATAIGTKGVDLRTRVAVALLFTVFEGGVPVIGVALGRAAAHSLGAGAQLAGGLVLCAAGLYLLGSDLLGGHRHRSRDVTSLVHLVVLSALLSLDNLVVGFGLGTYRVSLAAAAIVLGVVGGGLGLAGLELGRRIGTRAGTWSEALGGLVLVGVGAAIAAGA